MGNFEFMVVIKSIRFFHATSHLTTLRPLATDPSGELDVFRHDGYALRMDRTEVRVFEQANKICLGRLLQSPKRRRTESQIRLEVLSYLAHQPLERLLSEE